MKQFILNCKPDRDDLIRLTDDDYRYLVRVRRLAVGEFFSAVLPDGTETQVQVLSVDHSVLTGKCVCVDKAAVLSDVCLPPVILLQALPKGEKMDLIVRQAAEGGITEIVPFVSEFSIAKISAGGQKFLRWERIIKEARQQSGSLTATMLHTPLAIDELFDYWSTLRENGATGLLFHQQACEHIAQASLHEYLDNVPPLTVLTVGPEGGFSESEVSRFLEAGFRPFTIGGTILRTETAALYCAAITRIVLMERNSWKLNQTKTGSV